ncbi:MAG: CarD family transcriptional regulator [Candidatus Gracilibacteria bacterium]|nr:CarD family transcriptional regulator [Candidatus Gracilibacteria bacterium]
MIYLKREIQKNKVYTQAGNIFSKLIFSKSILNNEACFLIVVENEKHISNYIKIAKYLGIKLDIMDNISDIINLVYNGIGTYIVTKDFFSLDIESKNQFEYKNIFSIKKGYNIAISELTKKLNSLEIIFNEYQNPNTFFISGDTLNFTDKSGQLIKISFWDNEVDEIFIGSKLVYNYTFGLNKNVGLLDSNRKTSEALLEIYKSRDIFTILDNIDFYSSFDDIFVNLKEYVVFSSLGNFDTSFSLGFNDLVIHNIDELKAILEDKTISKYIFTKNKKTINNFLNLNNLDDVLFFETDLNNLKSLKNDNLVLICDDNISRIFIKKRIKRTLSENMDLLMQIKPGDYIVHIDHGVGVFREIVEKELSGIKKEYITLEYKNSDKLFVPITEINRVSKYVGVENPKLTALSTKEWEKKIKKVGEDVEQIAGELLEIYAKRKLQIGHSFKSDKYEESKFFNSFEYEYTPDQYNVINDIYKDMESENPMDRLLSGDVGFGKTEVAFASIFKAIINRKQAALISPLVVLAYEHFEKAKERFASFPFNIEVITRFEKPSVIKTTLKKLSEGKIDLIIGTHRLLSEDVIFHDLGLLVIDEEHKFGVKDKEKIKSFKGNIDILSMSATPIPRSLNMALNGIKQVSMLTTPPVGKQSIQTIVSSFDDDVIFEACKREFERGGQVFFIHNRVETITGVQAYLEKLLPGKSVIVAHGQLPGDTLEKRIIEFKRKQYDILLATTVVENGIDFRDVNTIFINEANNFGISQIHQLRGRVGRGINKGFCYLLFRKDIIKEDAAKRLKTIVDYSHLGAGFELAIKDLEIRGGGDILGIRQSGSSVEIGVSLFLEMLEDKIEELKVTRNIINEGETNLKRIDTVIDLNIEAYITDKYFSSELDKINFYREIESIRDIEDLDNLINDFKEINGNFEKPTQNLFDIIRLKILSSKYEIRSIRKLGINYQIDFDEKTTLDGLKRFLILDTKLNFSFVIKNRLRSPIKNFANEEKLLEYLLFIFENKPEKKRIILKKN